MKMLYVTPYLPYEGVPYAGGYFLYEYLVRLSAYVDVHVIAPRTEENEFAAAKLRHEFKVELLGGKPVKKSKAARLLPVLWNHLVHPMSIPEMDNLSKELGKPGYLDGFDAVEMHFSQSLPLAKIVKKARPELPTVIFAHDVFSQSVHRRVRGAPLSPGKLFNAIKSLRVSSVEASLMNRCDGAFVFSDKDKNILGGMGVRTRVEVLVPSVELPRRTAALEGGPVCLFVGAMDRPENYEAASWLLSNVWPDVLERVPGASLNIVGGNPPAHLTDRAFENVTVTGFVKELDPYYREASVCVAPLLTGAGVKFKVLQAMAYGLPVVTTPVGAEGIAENEPKPLLECVTTDPGAFSDGVVRYLQDETLRKRDGFQLRRWMENHYDFEKNTVQKALLFYEAFYPDEERMS